MIKKIIIICIALVVLVLIGALLSAVVRNSSNTSSSNEDITNFDQCVAAGNPIQESYPEVCRTPDGKSFVNPAQKI